MDNTREKLIELLDSGNICPKGITSCLDCPYYKKYSFGIPCDEKAAIADRMIANGVTVQKWIPVTERLPEIRERVLVYHDDGLIRFGINYGGFADVVSSIYLNSHHHTCFSKVTHWMPLPSTEGLE